MKKRIAGRRLLGRLLAEELTESDLASVSGQATAIGISRCPIDYTPTRDPKTGEEID